MTDSGLLKELYLANDGRSAIGDFVLRPFYSMRVRAVGVDIQLDPRKIFSRA